MIAPQLFFDSSALFAGVASQAGAPRALLMLDENGIIGVTASEQVIAETERALARKAPQALPYYRQALRSARITIVHDPAPDVVFVNAGLTSHAADLPILVAARRIQTDFLVTLDRRHFIDDPQVAARAGIRIGTPGDALAWVRSRLEKGTEDSGSTEGGQ